MSKISLKNILKKTFKKKKKSKVKKKPNLDYSLLTSSHVLFDLIYNPIETAFMKEGAAYGATVSNGLAMLKGQAEASWKLWNN